MTTTVSDDVSHVDDRAARRNALVLALAQAFYGMGAINIAITAGLVGTQLAPSLSLATLPVSTFVIGTALATVPASLFMRRVGRKAGFLTGAMFGCIGALVCVYAIFARQFWLFAFGTFLQGGYQAFAGYYRFAAADTASALFKPKAISWVMLGGIAAAVFGPMIVIVSRSYFEPVMFAGNFAAVAALSIVAMAIISFVNIPHKREDLSQTDARPLAQITAPAPADRGHLVRHDGVRDDEPGDDGYTDRDGCMWFHGRPERVGHPVACACYVRS